MQDGRLTGVAWPAKLGLDLAFEAGILLISQERIGHPRATWPRHVVQQAQVPLLPGFLDVHEHSSHFDG